MLKLLLRPVGTARLAARLAAARRQQHIEAAGVDGAEPGEDYSSGADPAQHPQLQLLTHIAAANPRLRRALGQVAPAARAGPRSASAPLEPESRALRALRTLPLTTYEADYAADCARLLAAQRAGASAQDVAALAAPLCGEAPLQWLRTTGTTSGAKVFPVTPATVAALRRCAANPARLWDMIFEKLPLEALPAHARVRAPPPAPGGEGWSELVPRPRRHSVLSLLLTRRIDDLPGGVKLGSMASLHPNMRSRAGHARFDSRGAAGGTQPPKLLFVGAAAGAPVDARYYAMWLTAAAAPGLHAVTALHDYFPGNTLAALEVLQHRWRDVVADLRAGRLLPARASEAGPDVTALVDAHLASAPPGATAAAASRLERAMRFQEQQEQHAGAGSSGGARLPLLHQLMPHLQAVVVTATGSQRKYVPALRRLLAPHTAIVSPVYAATEAGALGVNSQLLLSGAGGGLDAAGDPGEQRYTLLPDGPAFLEFIPAAGAPGSGAARGPPPPGAAAAAAAAAAAVTMAELEVGRAYEVAITTFSGLTRLRIGDVVRVTGWQEYCEATQRARAVAAPPAPGERAGAALAPVVAFERRAGVALNLVWELYDEATLLRAVLSAADELAAGREGEPHGSPEPLLPFPGLADFAAAEVTVPAAQHAHYRLYWEPRPSPRGAPLRAAAVAAWERVLDAALQAHHPGYVLLRASGEVAPARIVVVRPGTFAALRAAAVARGAVASQVKTPSVVALGGWQAALLDAGRAALA